MRKAVFPVVAVVSSVVSGWAVATEALPVPLAERSDPGPITGIALAPDGGLYVAGGLKQPLQRLSRTGRIETAWGGALIQSKHGIRRYGRYLYVTDIGNHQVHKMDLTGRVLLSLGERGVSGCDETHFNQPTDVAVAPNGDIYVTDGYGNSRIVCFDATGRFKFAWGTRGDGPGEFFHPHNIVIGPEQRIYVADRDNRRLQLFTMTGKHLETRQETGGVFGLDLDPEGKRLFYTVCRPDWHGVVMTALDGKKLGEIGGKGKAPGEFDVPHSLVYDPVDDALFVGEVNNRRIQKVPLK